MSSVILALRWLEPPTSSLEQVALPQTAVSTYLASSPSRSAPSLRARSSTLGAWPTSPTATVSFVHSMGLRRWETSPWRRPLCQGPREQILRSKPNRSGVAWAWIPLCRTTTGCSTCWLTFIIRSLRARRSRRPITSGMKGSRCPRGRVNWANSKFLQ